MKTKLFKSVKYALRWMPDIAYIQLYYFASFRKFCNLKNPVTYNEKLNWLKLHDHNPIYTKLVDKYEVKEYVAKLIGEKYIIPTLGVWEEFDEIDFDKLPNQFVLKCTHDSAGLVIVKDKNNLDINYARRVLQKALSQNFYYIGREWPYKNVKPRIIAEKYMEDEDGELKDYKFFCFNGEPKIMFLLKDRSIDTRLNFYDLEFNKLPFARGYPNFSDVLKKPKGWESMIKLSQILSTNFPHVRVDFYNINGDIYFGELTFYPGSGFERFKPQKWDKIVGDWLKLPKL